MSPRSSVQSIIGPRGNGPISAAYARMRLGFSVRWSEALGYYLIFDRKRRCIAVTLDPGEATRMYRALTNDAVIATTPSRRRSSRPTVAA